MSHPRTAAEIREAFLSFFEERGHQRLASDSLIPSSDPTLLFTGAGMNQFKDEFLGKGRDLQRATTSQKCLRVPDLENVGATPRHHTFFEMLGNFSFGDYFKAETIPWEWTFFTEVLGWDPARFVCTVYEDDDEAFKIWTESVGMAPERIYRFGEKENFWPSSAPSKGPNGLCGPCSELYFDMQPDLPLPPDTPEMQELPDERFLEVGNFVFTQFDRKDGGILEPLPNKNIDVGLGLERVVAVAQGAANNFETDLFAPLLAALQEGSGKTYGKDSADDVRMRRVADHARAVFFCIADGAAPGREGRGYVVRKILRRAVRDGIDLGFDQEFLAGLLPAVQATMGEAYPQLHEQADTIQALCAAEESRFRDVYRKGVERLELELDRLEEAGSTRVLPGAIAFELHDTFGFPADITEVVARDRGFDFDAAGFNTAMESQRDRARAGTEIADEVFAESTAAKLQSTGARATEFCGYNQDACQAKVVAILCDGESVSSLSAKQDALVVLNSTPFYAEGGGQVGDQGQLERDDSTVFRVHNTRNEDGYFLHEGRAEASLAVGDTVVAKVDEIARRATERHHTATHLLHAALKEVLGQHVNQAGSSVGPERLRFDYTHPEGPSLEQLQAVEDLVLQQILHATEVGSSLSSLEQAKARGVTALFGEKYGDEVRVVEVPGFSAELCGGTHVNNVGAIGSFRILSDRALAAGVRRLEAVAGFVALAVGRHEQTLLQQLEGELKAPSERLLERIQSLKTQLKEAKQAKTVAAPDASALAGKLEGSAPLGWSFQAGLDAEALRALADGLREQSELPDVVVLLGGEPGTIPFVILANSQAGWNAGQLAKGLGKHIRGGGGGRPDFAQGKGGFDGDLAAALAAFQDELVASQAS